MYDIMLKSLADGRQVNAAKIKESLEKKLLSSWAEAGNYDKMVISFPVNHVHHEFEVSILPGSPVATAGAEPNPAGVDMDVTERTKLKFKNIGSLSLSVLKSLQQNRFEMSIFGGLTVVSVLELSKAASTLVSDTPPPAALSYVTGVIENPFSIGSIAAVGAVYVWIHARRERALLKKVEAAFNRIRVTPVTDIPPAAAAPDTPPPAPPPATPPLTPPPPVV